MSVGSTLKGHPFAVLVGIGVMVAASFVVPSLVNPRSGDREDRPAEVATQPGGSVDAQPSLGGTQVEPGNDVERDEPVRQPIAPVAPDLRSDPGFEEWLQGFVSSGLSSPPPEGYHGTSFALRVDQPNEITPDEYARLIAGIGLLASGDQIALLHRISVSGSPREADLLAKQRDSLTRSTRLVHTMYTSAILNILKREHRALVLAMEPSRRSWHPDLHRYSDLALAAVLSERAFVKQRGIATERAGWAALERHVKLMTDYGYAALPAVRRDWEALAQELVEPLVSWTPDVEIPPHLDARVHATLEMKVMPAARGLMDSLEVWPSLRAGLERSQLVSTEAAAQILRGLVFLVWKHGGEPERTRLVNWLRAVREQALLTESEARAVGSVVGGFAGPGSRCPEAARLEFSKW